MKSIITIIAVLFLALICSPTADTDNEIGTELFKLNLTSLERLLNADRHELARKLNQLGVADEIGGILVVAAEILLVLTVLLLWGIFAFLAAVVTVGGTLMNVILSVIFTNFQDVLDFVRDFAYEILPPAVNLMIDDVDMPKLANLLDHTLPWSKTAIVAAVVGGILYIVVVAIFGMSIFILLKVRSNQRRCCCGGGECKRIAQDATNNNDNKMTE